MRKLSLVLGFLAIVSAAERQRYEILPSSNASTELHVAKTGLMRGKKHIFVFDRYQGTLQYDPNQPDASHVKLTIDARSASCKDTWLSAKDLHKVQQYALNDMLAADRYPDITFVSTEIRQAGAGQFEVRGTLTIREITKPAMVLVTVASQADGALTLAGTSQIRLTDFNLKPPSAALGTIGTKDEMSFSFSLLASPRHH